MNALRIFVCITTLMLGNNYSYAETPSSGTCAWERADGTIWYANYKGAINLGTLYIPRDAPVGSIIGSDWVNIPINTSQMKHLVCYNRAGISTSVNGATVINNITAANNRVPAGSIYSTNIPGVGIAFKTSDLNLSLESGTKPYFPYSVRVGFLEKYTIPNIPVSVLLIKTGNISMGAQTLNATSQIIVDGANIVENFVVNAKIVRSECSLPTASKQISVFLGNVSISNLKTSGVEGAELQSFSIPLTDCISGSYPNVPNNLFTSSYVNLTLAGNSGSSILDAQQGVLGLNSKSTATGVAVQILNAGSNLPMPLGTSKQMKRIIDGGMSLDFNARYIKIGDTPTAGTANASATFTITYK